MGQIYLRMQTVVSSVTAHDFRLSFDARIFMLRITATEY